MIEKSRIATLVYLLAAAFSSCGLGDIDPNLAAWWRFDDANGTVARDSAGSANGTLMGDPNWTKGIVAGALEFDGIDDYVDLGNPPVLNELAMSDFTIAMWIKTSQTHRGILIGNFDSGTPFWSFEIYFGGTLTLNISGVYHRDDAPIGDDEWHHVVTKRAMQQEVAIYIDGEESYKSPRSIGGPFAVTANTMIARCPAINSPEYQGLMDDVRIYDTALTQEQIRRLPGRATSPSPHDEETKVNIETQFTWVPGNEALSHDIYFGTDSPPAVLIGDDMEEPTIDPGPLEYGVTYHWRVDENIPEETVTGKEWSFTTAFWPGRGEPNDPFRISDIADLIDFSEQSDCWTDCFVLTADINIPPEISMAHIGDYPSKFDGVFDARGHTISGFAYRIGGSNANIGLFAKTGPNAQIKNLGLELGSITTDGLFRAGLLVADNEGAITDCYSTGSVVLDAMAYSNDVGGLVGFNKGAITNCCSNVAISGLRNQAVIFGGLVGNNEGRIINCYTTGTLSRSRSSLGSQASRLGGLAGLNNGTIKDCYSIVAVSATAEHVDSIGGLVGSNRGIIAHCYSTGSIYARATRILSDVGGLVGYNNGTVTNSFWDTDASGMIRSAAGTGKTTAEMMQQATFDPPWDFPHTWGIGENQTYPYLRMEPFLEADVDGDGDVDFQDFANLARNWMIGPE